MAAKSKPAKRNTTVRVLYREGRGTDWNPKLA
jgi:hypothetical protein